MSEQTDSDWTHDLATLANRTKNEALRLHDLLLNEMSMQAKLLIDEGFLVPAPEALQYYASVFIDLTKREGGGLWQDKQTARESLNFICAFVSLVQGLERELDMQAFSSFSLFMQSKTFKQAQLLSHLALSPGGEERITSEIRQAYLQAQLHFGRNR